MKMFIKIKNGMPFEHPIVEDNFKQAFPNLDINDLPSEFAVFERVDKPLCGPYELITNHFYQWHGNVVKDVWNIRIMDEQEKTELQNKVKTEWLQNGFASWLFDEEECLFTPPIPYPEDGKRYTWDEENKKWNPL